jgi:hypothetical protein
MSQDANIILNDKSPDLKVDKIKVLEGRIRAQLRNVLLNQMDADCE